MKLSIVIPTRNRADTIGQQLDALARQQWTDWWEVVVADNGSTDDTRATVERHRSTLPNLRIVDAADRPGQAYAMNVGAHAARGEALLFCDDDDEVGEGWLMAMGRGLEQHRLVGCRWDIDALNHTRIRDGRGNPQSHGVQQYSSPPYLPHTAGNSLGIHRDLHVTIGGFDEGIPISHDTDYCWRAQEAGATLHFVGDAIVHVRFRKDLDETFRQAIDYGRASALLLKRHRPCGMPRASLRDAIGAWALLLLRVPRLARTRKRARWIWKLGWRLGRLDGSIRYRVVAF